MAVTLDLRASGTGGAARAAGPSHGGGATPLLAPPADFYRRVVEGMTCGILTIDRQGRITTINDHAQAILELGGRSAIGEPCREALAHCPRVAEVLMEAFSMASPPSRAEMETRTSDGRRRSLGFSISMILSSIDGSVQGAALFFKDLTRVEELEERERLRDRLAVLGEMAAQMAHEIRNPLTSIEISAALMKRRLAGRGEATDLPDKIAVEAARIEATIAGCLQYARPLTPDSEAADPVSILDEAMELVRAAHASPGISIDRRYDRTLPPLRCDRGLVREALVNLLNNAFEAMGHRGTLTVTASIAPGCRTAEPVAGRPRSTPARAGDAGGGERYLLVKVTDTGPGIPAELKDRIFYPFFTTKTSGSGIGLAMARKVVESHGGWLDVDSEPGRGATFILKLPIQT